MFWWNVDGLVRALKADLISERQKSRYFLATVLLTITLVLIYHILPQTCPTPERTVIHFIGGIFYLIIAAWGIRAAYHTNQAGDNKNFAERVTCLSLPISIRIITYFLIVAVPVGIIRAFMPLKNIWGPELQMAGSGIACASNIIGLLTITGLNIWYFIWIRGALRSISGASNSVNAIRILIHQFRRR